MCYGLNQVLSSKFNVVYEWIKTNILALNIYKTKGIVFGSPHKLFSKRKLELSMSGKPKQVDKVKLLRLALDSHLCGLTTLKQFLDK